MIDLKEKDKKDQSTKKNKAHMKMLTDTEISSFCKNIKPFEFYGCQRDLSPDLKRIVKNLACQEHQYVYCPGCKQYEEGTLDPVAKMRQFLKYIKEEQDKIDPPSPERGTTQKARHPHMPDDSVSDFTDLDKEEVLAKYYEDKLTVIERKKRDRAEARRRLRGDKGPYDPR